MPRRDAARFADLLDSQPQAHPRTGRDSSSTVQEEVLASSPLAGQLAIVAALRAMEFDVGPSELSRARQRQRLVAMAAVRTTNQAEPQDAYAGVPATDGPARFGAWSTALANVWSSVVASFREGLFSGVRSGRHRVVRRRATGSVAAFSLVVATAGVLALIAQSSLPGDPLYSFKRGTEQAQLAFAAGQREQGTELLGFATIRLNEIKALLDEPGALTAVGGAVVAARGEADPDLLMDTMTTMDEQTIEGTNALTNTAVDESSVPTLRFVAEWGILQFETLHTLTQRMPEPAQPRAEESKDLLQRVVMRLEDLAETLACDCFDDKTDTDDLGPLPCPTCTETVQPDSGSATTSPATSTEASSPTDQAPPTTPRASTAPPAQTPAPSATPTPTSPTTTSPTPSPTTEPSPSVSPPVDPPPPPPPPGGPNEGDECLLPVGALGIPIPGVIIGGVCVALGG